MSQYKAYPGYKDSGVEWIGQVPEEWLNRKVFHAFQTIGSGTTPPSKEHEWYQGGTIPWITTSELRENTVVETKKCVTSEAMQKFSALKIFPAGSLAIAMYGATIGRLGLLGIPATTNQACCVLSGERDLNIQFLYYWLMASRAAIVALFSEGGGQPNINQEVIASLWVPSPEPDEQATIAATLDRETSRIDALIQKKTRFIELLKEKRQALITHAVTKGLDPNVKMKDSGVEWIGQVPEHWKVAQIKRISALNPKKSTLSEEKDSLCTFLPMEKLRTNAITLDETRPIHEVYDGYSYFCDDDILIAKVTPCFENGNIAVANGLVNGIGFGSTEINVLRVNGKGHNRFLYYRLQEEQFRTIAKSEMRGTGGLKRVPTELFESFTFGLPDTDEQATIAATLDRETARIDALIGKAEHSITLLKERRAAFITAAVTGQIDLRGEQ